jgi:hypothetical protein
MAANIPLRNTNHNKEWRGTWQDITGFAIWTQRMYISLDNDQAGQGVARRSPVTAVPLTRKFPMKPGRHSMPELYAGIQLNAAPADDTAPALMAAVTASSHIDKKTESVDYRRYGIKLGVGNKFGFITRGRKL